MVGRYVDGTSQHLFWAMFYNGREEEVERLYWDMDDFDRRRRTGRSTEQSFFRPDYIECCPENDDVEVLWMVLVQRFGDYGTSPRSGWIGAPWFDRLHPARGGGGITEAVEYLRQNIVNTFNPELELAGNLYKEENNGQ